MFNAKKMIHFVFRHIVQKIVQKLMEKKIKFFKFLSL